MSRRVLVCFLAICCSPTLYGQEQKPSPAVKRILDKAVTEVRKNRQEFDKANMTPLGEARVELEELSTKLIKDGRTAEATAVLKQIETLESDVMKMAKAPEPLPGGVARASPQKPLLERLDGKWKRVEPDQVWTITADGGVRVSNGPNGRVVAVSPESAEIVFNTGWKHRLLLAHEDIACSLSWTPQGQQACGFVLERIK